MGEARVPAVHVIRTVVRMVVSPFLGGFRHVRGTKNIAELSTNSSGLIHLIHITSITKEETPVALMSPVHCCLKPLSKY